MENKNEGLAITPSSDFTTNNQKDTDVLPQSASDLENPMTGSALFSDESTSVETENLPTNLSGAPANQGVQPAEIIQSLRTKRNGGAPANQSRISNAFAKTDATKNAPVIDIDHPTQTISSANNDIEIPGAPKAKKKSKKPLIIVVAALVVLAVVGGVVGVINGVALHTGEATIAINDVRNKFINYYLYGAESTEPLSGEYSTDGEYKILSAIENRDTDFLNKTRELFEDFTKEYNNQVLESYKSQLDNNSDQNNEEEITNDLLVPYRDSVVEDYIKTYDFVYRYGTTNTLSKEDLLDKFFSSGVEGATTLIQETYRSLSQTSHERGAEYARSLIEYDQALVGLWEIYNNSGCLENQEVVEECPLNIEGFDYDGIMSVLLNKPDADVPESIIDDSIEQIWSLATEEL